MSSGPKNVTSTTSNEPPDFLVGPLTNATNAAQQQFFGQSGYSPTVGVPGLPATPSGGWGGGPNGGYDIPSTPNVPSTPFNPNGMGGGGNDFGGLGNPTFPFPGLPPNIDPSFRTSQIQAPSQMDFSGGDFNTVGGAMQGATPQTASLSVQPDGTRGQMDNLTKTPYIWKDGKRVPTRGRWDNGMASFDSSGSQPLPTQYNANNLMGGAQSLVGQTIQGDFLGPDSNPYLRDTFNRAADLTQTRLASEFAGSGRNLGAALPARSDELQTLASNIYGGNYQAERGRQQGAADQAQALDPLNLFINRLAGIIPGAGGSSQSTQPVFRQGLF